MEKNDEPAFPVGVAPDGTVTAATPLGTLVIELCGAFGAAPEVVTSMQEHLASPPRELARYPLRHFLALVLRAFRSGPGRRRLNGLALASRVPQPLRVAQRVALAQFVRVNYRALMLLAHARRPGAHIRSFLPA